MSAPVDIVHNLQSRLQGPLASLLQGPGRVCIRSAPGRLDVLGGLAVEAGGTLAQAALPHRAAVAVQLRNDGKLVIRSEEISPPVGEPEFAMDLADFFTPGGSMTPARALAPQFLGARAWAAPLVGLFYVLHQTPASRASTAPAEPVLAPPPRGATLIIHSAIALGSGQAASTAVVTAALAALSDVLSLKIDPLEQALYVHRAEALFLPTSNTVIDALTCLNALPHAPGTPQHVLRYSAQPHTLVGHVPLPPDLRLIAFDTGVRYTAAADTVAAIRLAGAMGLRIIETIYRDLGQRHTPLHGHLANLSPSLYRQYFRALLPKRMRGRDFIRTYGELPERAGTVDDSKMYRVRTAVDHLIAENEHAENFLQTLEELTDPAAAAAMTPHERELTLRRAGRLMLASQHSYRLRLELSCREADWLIDQLMESESAGPANGVYGGRITATGGGGTVALLLNRSPNATDALLKTLSRYPTITGLHPTVAEAATSPGTNTT